MSLSTTRMVTRHLPALRTTLVASIARRPLFTAILRRPLLLQRDSLATRPLSTSIPRRQAAPEFARERQFEDDPSGPPPPEEPTDKSFTGRLKHLIKAYGVYAVGVYTVLSVFDFGLSFALINIVGAEHVSKWAKVAKEKMYGVLNWTVEEDPEAAGNSKKEGLAAMLFLAWTVHKTLFLPFRVGMTAAITPNFVKWLRSKGWAGGAGTRRAVTEMQDKLRERRAAKQAIRSSSSKP